jgi:hypothetical protein
LHAAPATARLVDRTVVANATVGRRLQSDHASFDFDRKPLAIRTDVFGLIRREVNPALLLGTGAQCWLTLFVGHGPISPSLNGCVSDQKDNDTFEDRRICSSTVHYIDHRRSATDPAVLDHRQITRVR